ncbi:MAG: hypothetical protein RI953_1581 [Pseudomonadota bacterium]|jgi:hypothetical protein
MSAKGKFRVTTRGARNNDRDARVIFWTLLLIALLGLTSFFSLGSRSTEPTNTFYTTLNAARNKVRGWESPAINVNNNNTPDTRSHAGFHFRWGQRFNPPAWQIESQIKSSRQDDLQKILKLGKSKITLNQRGDNEFFFDLKEVLLKDSNTFVQKKVLPLLPGEKLSLSYPPAGFIGKPWKIRLRSVAATQDRMDAPLILNYGFAHAERSILEIDPKGQAIDLDIPAVGEFARRGEKAFTIEWPSATSGLLVVDGFQPTAGETDSKNLNPRSLVILIDSLAGTLTDLNKTIKALKNATSGSHSTIHLTNVVPPADSIDLSFKSLLTLHSPLELGATLDNQRLKEMIVAEPVMLRKYSERGGSLRHLTLSHVGRSCPDVCPVQETVKNEFTATFAIRRSEEIASTSDAIRNDEFMTDNGALFVETDFPADYFRLNWTTAFEQGESIPRWLVGGLREIMGGRDLALRNREKLIQMDEWLAKIIGSFYVTSGNANIAIFLHQNNTPIRLGSTPESKKSLVRGEALFSVNNFNLENAQKEDVHTITSTLSQVSAARLLERLSFGKERSVELAKLTEGLDFESSPVVQFSHDSITTLTSNGWLVDQIPHRENKLVRPLFHAEPEQIHTVQEKSIVERRRSRLHGLHVLFPNNNEKDELLSVSLSTNLHPLGCESESEHAQLDPKVEVREESSSALKTYHILGRRSAQNQWHIQCLLEGRITTATRLRIVPRLNNQAIAREKIGLGEFALPIRGFLWRSPETLELTGAQILDATVSLTTADKDAARQSSVVIWTERFLGGIPGSRAVFAFADKLGHPAQPQTPRADLDKPSGK